MIKLVNLSYEYLLQDIFMIIQRLVLLAMVFIDASSDGAELFF